LDLLRFDGHIVGASFESGDTIVAGRWRTSPFGPFADVMWRRADGRRVLLAPTEATRAFVTSHYNFDEAIDAPVRIERDPDGAVRVTGGPIDMTLRAHGIDLPGRLIRLRPRWLRERPAWIAVEDALLRPVVGPLFGANGVHVRGTTGAGAREWYAIHDVRAAIATATVDGASLGATTALSSAGFGFSEFPSRSTILRVTSLIERR
jgi:hypothetical protein